VTFPVVALTSVVDELDRFEAPGESSEHPAGVDLGELPGIADQDNLGPGPLRCVEDGSEGPGAGHPGFVDDQNGPVVEVPAAIVELDAQHGEGGGWDAG
jgi:hypothetical protein